MSKTQNPFPGAWEAKRLNSTTIAISSGLSTAAISQHIHGHRTKPAPGLLKALASLGYDPDALTRQYVQWRQEQAQEILAAIAAGQ